MAKKRIIEIEKRFYFKNKDGVYIEVSVENQSIANQSYVVFKIIDTGREVHKVLYNPERGLDRIPEVEYVTNTSKAKSGSNTPTHTAKRYIAGRAEHSHTPGGSKRWKKVQRSAQKSPKRNLYTKEGRILYACANFEPKELVEIMKTLVFANKPMARRHFEHYLKAKGRVFNENENIKRVLKNDEGVLTQFSSRVNNKHKLKGHFKLEQHHYEVEDFQYAWGGIDRFDWEVTDNRKTVNIWFADRYEFHPIGFGYKGFRGGGDDDVRVTNCIHAAMVEMKKLDAADYWMKGRATFPISFFQKEPLPSAQTLTPPYLP